MERRLLTVLIGLLVCASAGSAQNLVWSKHYGGYFNEGGYGCQPTTDGGYIAVGSTFSYGSGDHDLYLIKLDSLGDTLWTKTVGGALADYGRDLQVTPDGGYLCVGSTASFGAGKEDLFLVKVNAYGDILWTKTFGGAASDEAWSIRATSDSAYIMCGTTNSSGAGYADLWLVKVDQNGALVWSRTFGGPGGESGMAVRETWDGYVAVGATGSFGEGYSSMYAVKVTESGDSVWAKSFGGPKADFGYSLEITADNGYLLVGATGSYGLGYYDAYLVKTGSDGTVEWEKTFGGVRDDRAYAAATTPDGNYVFTGTTESFGAGGSDIYVVKVTPLGEQLWSVTQGGSQADYCRSICLDNHNNYVLAGYSYSYTTGGSDLYMASFVGDQATPVEEHWRGELPDGYALGQNYPNPFNASTTIQYTIPRSTEVRLAIYNVLGQAVKTWPMESRSAGTYLVHWDGRSGDGGELSSGVYFFRLETAAYTSARKLLLLK